MDFHYLSRGTWLHPSKQAHGGPPGGPRRHLWRPAGGKRKGAPGESETGFAEGPRGAAPPREGISPGGPLDDFIQWSAVVKNEWGPPQK